jgi:hypothetical protein
MKPAPRKGPPSHRGPRQNDRSPSAVAQARHVTPHVVPPPSREASGQGVIRPGSRPAPPCSRSAAPADRKSAAEPCAPPDVPNRSRPRRLARWPRARPRRRRGTQPAAFDRAARSTRVANPFLRRKKAAAWTDSSEWTRATMKPKRAAAARAAAIYRRFVRAPFAKSWHVRCDRRGTGANLRRHDRAKPRTRPDAPLARLVQSSKLAKAARSPASPRAALRSVSRGWTSGGGHGR